VDFEISSIFDFCVFEISSFLWFGGTMHFPFSSRPGVSCAQNHTIYHKNITVT
jgi:hypothetical protein